MTGTRSWIQSAELKSFPPLFPASMCRKPNGPKVLLTDGAWHMSITTQRRTAAFTAVWGGNLADGCLVNVWGAFWAQCPLVVDRNTVHKCTNGNIPFGTHRLFHLMTQTSPQMSEVMELPVILSCWCQCKTKKVPLPSLEVAWKWKKKTYSSEWLLSTQFRMQTEISVLTS